MEGACGKIVDTDDPLVVIKKVYRKPSAHRRIKSHRAPKQCEIQVWASSICKPENGFQKLFVPKAWSPTDHQYSMERIDVSVPIDHKEIVDEIRLFMGFARKEKIYPCDYELYKQADGRVAMVDFDKFGEWHEDGHVTFPWGLTLLKVEMI